MTETEESQGSFGVGYDPDDASKYAQQVQALLNGEGEVDYEEEQSLGETEFEAGTEEQSDESEQFEEFEEEQSEAEEADEQEEKQTSEAARYRIKAKNEVERTALALHKANPSWTLEQSLEAAKKLHPDAQAETETQEQSESLQSVEEQIANLKERRKVAIKEFDADAQIEIEEQIDALREKKSELALQERSKMQSEEQRFYAEASKFEEEAVKLYPDAANPQSALAKEMARIDKDLIAHDDPLIYSTKKALKVAQMAAANLAIAPRSTMQKQTTVKRASQRPALPTTSGQTRSTATPVTQTMLDQDMSLSEYEAFVSNLT